MFQPVPSWSILFTVTLKLVHVQCGCFPSWRLKHSSHYSTPPIAATQSYLLTSNMCMTSSKVWNVRRTNATLSAPSLNVTWVLLLRSIGVLTSAIGNTIAKLRVFLCLSGVAVTVRVKNSNSDMLLSLLWAFRKYSSKNFRNYFFSRQKISL